MKKSLSPVLALGIVLAADETLLAQVPPADNIPNWPTPATWSPSRAGGGLAPMTDISLAIPFIAVTPCRVADTRPAEGYTGTQGPPALTTGVRLIDVGGTVAGLPHPQCGIPASAQAVSFQFTIVSPNSNGNLVAWPVGGTEPTISILNWSAGETALGNGTIVPLGTNASINVKINAAIGGATAHLVVDVNGYFSPLSDSGNQLFWTTSIDAPAAVVGNLYAGSSVSYGMSVGAKSTGNGSAGVLGIWEGIGNSFTFGVKGITTSDGFDAAGVKGVSGYGDPQGDTVDCDPCFTAGVRGVDTGYGDPFTANGSYGVLGLSRVVGVGGMLLDDALATGGAATDAIDTDAEGYLGYRSTESVFYGVFSNGGTGGTGTKSFIEPHKSDPSKVIRYVALEGNEAGTYFRGRGRFQRGIATIEVPEDFRLVTAPEGLSIQVTPIGEMATVAVVSIGLDRIVVRGSRNVEFFYTVNGERAAFKGHKAIGEGVEFIPRKANSTMPRWLSEGQKRLLIENGTYRSDGTVNMETAQRLGWDRSWDRERTRPEPTPE